MRGAYGTVRRFFDRRAAPGAAFWGDEKDMTGLTCAWKGRRMGRWLGLLLTITVLMGAQAQVAAQAVAQPEPAAAAPVHRPGGEANLVLPDLSQVTFVGGIDGHTLLSLGLVVTLLGLALTAVVVVLVRLTVPGDLPPEPVVDPDGLTDGADRPVPAHV